DCRRVGEHREEPDAVRAREAAVRARRVPRSGAGGPMSAENNSYDCAAVDERLLDYLYDELPEAEEKRIEEHLAGCPRCRAEVAGYRRVRQAARALPVAEPSPDVRRRLLEA